MVTPSRARLSFRMNRVGRIERGLTGSIIGAFFEVCNCLGFGYLEHIYTSALERELLGSRP